MDAGWGWWGKKESKVAPVHPEQNKNSEETPVHPEKNKKSEDDDWWEDGWQEDDECCSDYQEQIDKIVTRMNEITEQETQLRVHQTLIKRELKGFGELASQTNQMCRSSTRGWVKAVDEEADFRKQDIRKQNLVIGQQNLFLSDIGKYPSNQIGSSNPLKPLLKRIENAEKMNKSIFTHSHEIEDIKLILKSMADRIQRLELRETS